MCFHKSNTATLPEISDHYDHAAYDVALNEQYKVYFHENGYDHKQSPVLTAQDAQHLLMKNWGLIPSFAKTFAEAAKARATTLNCRSEEMYKTASFKDAAKNAQRCLVPATGFYEPHWLDPKGKTKVPYYLHLKNQKIFSLAGLYSQWRDPQTGTDHFTYTLLTTASDPESFIGKIHNSKQRKVVIIPREFEKDFLNVDLKPDDVIELCRAFNGGAESFEAYTVSKAVHHASMPSDTPEILRPVPMEETVPVKKDIQGSLF